MNNFSQAYERLNSAQRLAVDTIEGPVLVVAGPGTGKTQVLATRIAAILARTDMEPRNILALTFTESAAKNMRERLVSLVGTSGYYVEITTFHSFCTSIITAYPEFFPIDRASKPISDVERFEVLQSCIHDLPLVALKPLNTPYFYLREIAKTISDLKREGWSPTDFETRIHDIFTTIETPTKKTELLQFQKQQQKNTELAQVYELYQKKMKELLRYDFDDMITLVVQALREHQDLLWDYQERFQYFLVDEYQDTNSAQNQVVQLLASHWEEQANIFVVGDPHQSIYRFQGASTENVMDFARRYPNAAVITLDKSYRCPTELTLAAHGLISHNSTAEFSSIAGAAVKTLRQALSTLVHSTKSKKDALTIWRAPSQTAELIQVAEEIKKLVSSGVAAEEIAVLYRNNKESVELSEILDKWEIPYEVDGGSNIFEYESLQQFLQLLKLIELYKTKQEENILLQVLAYPWLKLDVLSVYRLAHLSGKLRKPVRDVIASGFEELTKQLPDGMSEDSFIKIEKLLQKLNNWAEQDAAVTFPALCETILQESGFLEWAKQQPNYTEQLQYLHTLFEQIKQFASEKSNYKLADFLRTLDTLTAYGIAVPVADLQLTKGAIHLSTVHKAKGREWQYVFVIHCIDGVWGNGRERNLLALPSGLLPNTDLEKKEKNEDDRRLLYVAITRAKEKTYLTYPDTIIQTSRSKSAVASMFIEEITATNPELKIEQDDELLKKQDMYLAKLVAPRSQSLIDARTESFFKKVIADYKFSVSALNTYLRDPSAFVLQHLLLIPQAKAPYLSFGTAMHAALETTFRHYIKNETLPEKGAVFERFKLVLQSENLTADDFEKRLQYGKEVLESYLGAIDLSAQNPWQLELRFGAGGRRAVFDGVQLVGRIDRFDWIDKDKNLVKVIDYKTGSAKSRNVLLGATASAELSERELKLPESIRSSYKRQLLFYKLLGQLDPSFKAEVVEGIFEFVEPDKRTGKITRHAFDLPRTEVEELKELITVVLTELRELRFLQEFTLPDVEKTT